MAAAVVPGARGGSSGCETAGDDVAVVGGMRILFWTAGGSFDKVEVSALVGCVRRTSRVARGKMAPDAFAAGGESARREVTR
jgi:hypothetical protein